MDFFNYELGGLAPSSIECSSSRRRSHGARADCEPNQPSVRRSSLSRSLILNSPDFMLAASLPPSLRGRPRSTNNPFLCSLFRGINHFSAAQRLSYYSFPTPEAVGRSVGRPRPLAQSLARKRHGLEKMGGRDETTESERHPQKAVQRALERGLSTFLGSISFWRTPYRAP